MIIRLHVLSHIPFICFMSVVVLHRKKFRTPQLQSLAHNETFLCWFQTLAATAEEQQQEVQVQEQEAATTAVEELGYGESVIREWRLSRGHGDHGSVCPEGTSTYSQSHTKLHLPTFFYFLVFGFVHQFSYKFVTDLHHSFIYCEGHKTRNQRLGGHFYPHNQWIIIFQQIFLFDCLFVCLAINDLEIIGKKAFFFFPHLHSTNFC